MSSGCHLRVLWVAVMPAAVCGCAAPGGVGGGSSPSLFGGFRGTPWTILAVEMRGPYAVRNTERLASMLRRVDGMDARKVRVVHDPNGASRVFYGTYHRRPDPKTGIADIPNALKRDLRLIRLLQSDDGQAYFALAAMVPMPQPDVGNPEWALQRVRKPYTLQVAVFEAGAVPRYKQAAADLCADLRRKGYEAYYYHGKNSSLVTVGAFDRDAVRVVGGRVIYGDEVRRLQAQPDLAYNLTNGRRLSIITDGRSTPVASRLMMVPGFDPIQPDPYRPGRE